MKTKSKDSKIKVLLLITGSIAAVRIPLLVSQLAKENYEIRCVLSKNAEKLIKPLSLSILSSFRSLNFFIPDSMSPNPLAVNIC